MTRLSKLTATGRNVTGDLTHSVTKLWKVTYRVTDTNQITILTSSVETKNIDLTKYVQNNHQIFYQDEFQFDFKISVSNMCYPEIMKWLRVNKPKKK